MVIGNIDDVDLKSIRGWVQDLSHPERPVSLIVTDNDMLIGRILANQYREDLKVAGIGGGRHAFCLSYARILSPFEQHVIRVRHEADGSEIGRSPITLEPAQAFNATAQAVLAGILAQYGSREDTAAKIDFLAHRIEVLLQDQADRDSLRLRRRQYRDYVQRWRRRQPLDDGFLSHSKAPDPCSRALVVDDRVPAPNQNADSNIILKSH